MVTQAQVPGVYIEEVSSQSQPIAGVPTSTAAFVGAAAKGPVDAPLVVASFAEFTTQYGGLTDGMPLGYAVQQYFANGGREAVIARVEGSGGQVRDADLSAPALEPQQRGLWLLDRAKPFGILCVPPLAPATDVGKVTWDAAVALAGKRHAFVIVDPPAAWANAHAVSAASLAALVSPSADTAVYFPRLRGPDPLHGNQATVFAPCGAVAGIYARTDQAVGVWQSPAGAAASLLGFQGATVTLTAPELAALDALDVSAIRAAPELAVWGARTLAPKTATPQFQYVAVRRLLIFIEASLEQGLSWAPFEPNTPSLWGRIRTSIDGFLRGLWQQGALQGKQADEAYFVRFVPVTVSRQDVALGRLDILIGVAPLQPAEFVVLSLSIICAQP